MELCRFWIATFMIQLLGWWRGLQSWSGCITCTSRHHARWAFRSNLILRKEFYCYWPLFRLERSHLNSKSKVTWTEQIISWCFHRCYSEIRSVLHVINSLCLVHTKQHVHHCLLATWEAVSAWNQKRGAREGQSLKHNGAFFGSCSCFVHQSSGHGCHKYTSHLMIIYQSACPDWSTFQVLWSRNLGFQASNSGISSPSEVLPRRGLNGR